MSDLFSKYCVLNLLPLWLPSAPWLLSIAVFTPVRRAKIANKTLFQVEIITTIFVIFLHTPYIFSSLSLYIYVSV